MADMQPPIKDGQGKAFIAGAITFAAILATAFLEEHYPSLIKQMESSGYPVPFIEAGIGYGIAHFFTWWSSADLVDIVFIGPIRAYKRVKAALNSQT